MTEMMNARSTFHGINIECRYWKAGDVDQINVFYNDPMIRPSANIRGYIPRTNEQWLWEYRPADTMSPAYTLALHEDELVGIQAYIPIKFLRDGDIVETGKDEDTLVHPEYRGMGVLDRLYKLLLKRANEDGIKVIWGFTSTAVKPLLRNGYKVIGDIETLQKDFRVDWHDVKKVLSSWCGIVKAIEYLGARIRRAFSGRKYDDAESVGAFNGFIVREVNSLDAACDKFAFEFGRMWGGVTVHLSAEYLKWRVFDNPFKKYKMFAAYRGDDIIGISVFKFDDKSKVGTISELAAIPVDGVKIDDILRALIKPGRDLFEVSGYKRIISVVLGGNEFNSTAVRVLRSIGFYNVSSDSKIMVRTFNESDSEYYGEIKNWRISEILCEY
jgi:GNAT superfamily N-acetyltransferase